MGGDGGEIEGGVSSVGGSERSLLVATLDAPDMQAFCASFKDAHVNCNTNLIDLTDSIFKLNRAETRRQSQTDNNNSLSSPSKSASTERGHNDNNNRIVFASNLMKLTINDEIQSTFPLMILTDRYICCVLDPSVQSITQWKSSSENSGGDLNSLSEQQTVKPRLICVHKISQVLILKLMRSSTSVSLSVRTLAQKFEDLSNSLELNFEEFYDSSEQSKDMSAMPISYLTLSFRTIAAKERFAFLLQRRFDDIVKRRLSVIST